MSLSKKKLVKEFYTSNFYKNPENLSEFLHREVELYWNSSQGFNKMNFKELQEMSRNLAKSFVSMRAEISHLLKDKNEVTIRFTYFVKTIEDPEEEISIAHFIAIWKFEGDKLIKGYQISQPGDETPENLSSFLPTNF